MKRKCERQQINTCPKISIQITNENYMEVMRLSTTHPDEFEGKTVQFTVLSTMTPVMPIASQFFVPFRIIHCIKWDSGVWLLTKGNIRQYENNTW